MSLHVLTAHQKFPVKLNQLWAFISRPENLATITPPEMGFQILTPKAEIAEMTPGMLIEYIVRPVAGIPVRWLTEITQVQAPHYFIDEQRFGPYRFWHHRHILKEIPGGTEMTDIVYYKLPFGPLGELAHQLFVARKLQQIFSWRKKALEQKFGSWGDVPT